ncbi:hypothetical+protein [Methylocapsa aurea]|jgi:hypothetical protein|uniref:DUF5132 domain-containing protein n=1 Tax=Methylocapsa aurea TaxID=663610 RepID=UPI003D18BC9B
MSGHDQGTHASSAANSKSAAADGDAAAAQGLEGELGEGDSTILATIATVGAVGVGVLVLEAALLPGVALGVAAMAAPKFFPRLGSALDPLFKSTVRGAYKISQKTKELVAETQERVEDIVAEVDAESTDDVRQAADKA